MATNKKAINPPSINEKLLERLKYFSFFEFYPNQDSFLYRMNTDFEKELRQLTIFQNEIKKLQTGQIDIVTKLNESKFVFQELKLLPKTAKVYQLVGPTLLEVTLNEAKENVENRLDLLSKEEKKTLERIKETQQKHDKKKNELIAFQRKLMQPKQVPKKK
ncbi:prefoldin subunit [Anaeramoeba flamelloides]|uniref:Prefoldin subunit n=1 Tax=Anaeramoeba flamelloides TaxID=1746091 RepID=A0AAV8A2J6_9EUKA|nr:prefoldin subunit [Anaeramoeba flamelloides]